MHSTLLKLKNSLKNPMLQRIASGDSTVCDQDYDFTDSEVVNFMRWNAITIASAFGHSDIVNRLLEIQEVRDNAHALGNDALLRAVENNHPQVAHLLASVQWPRGVKDMPKSLQKNCLAVIQEGVRLSSSEKAVRGVLVSAYLGKDTCSLCLFSLPADPACKIAKATGSPCLFSLPADPVCKIAEYVGIDRPLDELVNDQARTVSLNKALFL